MADDTPKPKIPRPPSQADIDLVSSQQGMVSDEWAEAPAPKPPSPPEAESEGQPS
ncbi:hypothetical protein [Belnapia moabensis]|uniref:hypothetical protein n=1 Tax=Belnapia moabensis TaxID=365533 RepID=UPI0012EDBD92|nr:hypothetical protein [Belnapia moabensis]